MHSRSTVTVCAAGLTVSSLATSAHANVVLTQKHRIHSYQSHGPHHPVIRANNHNMARWNAARLDLGPDTLLVVDFGRKLLMILLHKEKTYVGTALQSPLEMMKATMNAQKDISDEDKQAAMQMMKGMIAGRDESVGDGL